MQKMYVTLLWFLLSPFSLLAIEYRLSLPDSTWSSTDPSPPFSHIDFLKNTRLSAYPQGSNCILNAIGYRASGEEVALKVKKISNHALIFPSRDLENQAKIEYAFMERLYKEDPLHFLQPYGVVQSHGFWLLLMEAGPHSLLDFLSPSGDRTQIRKPSLQDTLTIVSGILEILLLLEKLEIVHRDIKPDNFLLREDLTPILIDFGLSIDPSTPEEITQTFCGSWLYIPPEIYNQDHPSRSGFEHDIFSLGCLLFQMSTGTDLVSYITKKGRHPIPTLSPILLFTYMRTHFEAEYFYLSTRFSRPLEKVALALAHPNPRQRSTAAQAWQEIDSIRVPIQTLAAPIEKKPEEMIASYIEQDMESTCLLEGGFEMLSMEEIKEAQEAQEANQGNFFTWLTRWRPF